MPFVRQQHRSISKPDSVAHKGILPLRHAHPDQDRRWIEAKSVSTILALADAETAGQVMAAHEQAVTEALGLLERLAARAARGHHGDGQRAPRIATSGFVGAAFTHTTSRALDPQLHTHVVLANLAQGTDGRWSALDSRTLHREATTASYLYQHLLRAQLTERLGIAWTDVDRGVAEIEGVPLSVRRECSTRRRQIETALTERAAPLAGSGVRRRARHLAARAACLATRPSKRQAPVASFACRGPNAPRRPASVPPTSRTCSHMLAPRRRRWSWNGSPRGSKRRTA